MINYDSRHKDLDQLIKQVDLLDGKVLRIEPHSNKPGNITSVGIWIEDPISGQEAELRFRHTHGYWIPCGDGAGDPCTNGGNVMTGRDLG